MLLSGFVPPEIRVQGLRSARIGLVVSLVLLIAVAVPLTIHTLDAIQDQGFSRTVAEEVARWDPNSNIVSLDADAQPNNRATVDLVVATTSSDPSPAWQLADRLSASTGRQSSTSRCVTASRSRMRPHRAELPTRMKWRGWVAAAIAVALLAAACSPASDSTAAEATVVTVFGSVAVVGRRTISVLRWRRSKLAPGSTSATRGLAALPSSS